MMNGRYLVDGSYFGNSKGVEIKIYNQINTFKNNGYEIELTKCHKKIKGKSLPCRLVNYSLSLLNFIPTREYVFDNSIKNLDYIYIRYIYIEKSFVNFLLKVKHFNPKCKILMEIPTYPLDRYNGNNFLNVIKRKREMKDVEKLAGLIDRIVTYSEDDYIFGIQTIKLSNGVDTKNIKIIDKTHSTKSINVIAVAKHDYWHGYDRFINGLFKYYRNDGKEDIQLHVVGDGPSIKKYKSMVKKMNLEDNVIFYGPVYGEQLDEIYNKCDIGLDALGRHRSNVYYNSSLKGKEYLAKGLPIISGVKTELDSFKNFKYYYRVPADDSYIDLDEVISFYDSIYSSNIDRKNIVCEIRGVSERLFDLGVCFEPVLSYLNENN